MMHNQTARWASDAFFMSALFGLFMSGLVSLSLFGDVAPDVDPSWSIFFGAWTVLTVAMFVACARPWTTPHAARARRAARAAR